MGILHTRYIPCTLQVVYIFTKPLTHHLFTTFKHKLGVHSMTLTNLRGADKNHTKRNSTIPLANQISMTTNEESMTPKVETNHLKSNMAICRAITQSLPTTRLALNDSNGYST